MKKMKKRAFTYTEFFIVLVIVGMLAAITIPSFSKIREAGAKQKKAQELAEQQKAEDQKMIELTLTPLEKEDFQATLEKLQIIKEMQSKRLSEEGKKTYNVQKMFEVDGVTFYKAECASKDYNYRTSYIFFYMTTNKNMTVGMTATKDAG